MKMDRIIYFYREIRIQNLIQEDLVIKWLKFTPDIGIFYSLYIYIYIYI